MMTLRRFAMGLALILTATPVAAQVPQGSPIADYMQRGRNAINDLRYTEADSLARLVLALGDLLTAQQKIEALQLRAAAAFPDEQGVQFADSAIRFIRQIADLGPVQSPPAEYSWPGLDSLFSLVARMSQPARIRLGTRVAGSVLYVNGQPQGVLQGLRIIEVPAARTVQLSIRADGCVPWDTTLVAQAADAITIGFRFPRCSK